MISLRVGTHEEFDGEGVAVPLVELGDHTLLRVETRILLLVSDLLLELLLGGVVDLAEARILEDEDILDFIHEAGFDYSVDLMVQDEVCQFMRQKQSYGIFLHLSQLEDRYGEEHPLVQIQEHQDGVIVHQGHLDRQLFFIIAAVCERILQVVCLNQSFQGLFNHEYLLGVLLVHIILHLGCDLLGDQGAEDGTLEGAVDQLVLPILRKVVAAHEEPVVEAKGCHWHYDQVPAKELRCRLIVFVRVIVLGCLIVKSRRRGLTRRFLAGAFLILSCRELPP